MKIRFEDALSRSINCFAWNSNWNLKCLEDYWQLLGSVSKRFLSFWVFEKLLRCEKQERKLEDKKSIGIRKQGGLKGGILILFSSTTLIINFDLQISVSFWEFSRFCTNQDDFLTFLSQFNQKLQHWPLFSHFSSQLTLNSTESLHKLYEKSSVTSLISVPFLPIFYVNLLWNA
jgi:hypothetical protein